jgi:hypothetical protein
VFRRRVAAALAALVAFAVALSMTGSPASANSFGTSGNATSISTFTNGSTQYVQNHNGDDFAFTNDTGISVDMRWRKCTDASVVGSIVYDIRPDHNYRNLGTNFAATTCLRIQYRGYTQTGSFSGTTFWNYSWV